MIWFDTGLRMQDGTPRTVCAINEAERLQCVAKDWKVVSVDKPVKVVEEKKIIKNITKTKTKTKKVK